jgi:hypothetical protein
MLLEEKRVAEMRKLFNLKEWLTISDAAKHLSLIFKEEVTEADVLRFCLDEQLNLAIYFPNKLTAKSTKIVSIKSQGFPQIDGVNSNIVGDNALSTKDDEIHYLEGLFDLPMIAGNKLAIECKYQKIIGGGELEVGYGAILVERYGQLFSLYSKLPQEQLKAISEDGNGNFSVDYVKREIAKFDYVPSTNFPENSSLVIKTKSLKEFETSINLESNNIEQPLGNKERNTLLIIIAALLKYDGFDPVGRETTSEILRMTEELGVVVSDDTIRNVLKKIPDAVESRTK